MAAIDAQYIAELDRNCPYLYFYTDERTMRGILNEGRIRPSAGAFGRGIYLTGLGPSHGKRRIQENNNRESGGNAADFCVRFDKKKIPGVENCNRKVPGRSMYLLHMETNYLWPCLADHGIEFYRI